MPSVPAELKKGVTGYIAPKVFFFFRWSALLTAITGLASGAITAAKKALGIASPSTIFAEIGMNTAKGMEGGVDEGADAVGGALEAMVAPPPAATTGAVTAKASGGPSVTINVSSMADALTLQDLLASLGAQVGVAVPSAA